MTSLNADRNARRRHRTAPLLTTLLAGAGLAAAACGSGAGSAPVNAPPASPHTAAEQAATRNWLAKTNQMWANDDFAALDQITTGEMRTVYRYEEQQAKTAMNPSRPAFQLTGLSITVPCQNARTAIFVAYGDTDVFTLGQGMQPVAMVFQRTAGTWKLAAAVHYPSGGAGWPALCRQRPATTAPALLAPDSYAPDLARVLTRAMTGAQTTTVTASPFAVNGFLAGSGSVNGQAATWIRQDRRAGVSFTGNFAPAPDPTFALPLGNGCGYWLIGFLTQTSTHGSPSGLRKTSWPDSSPVATPRPAVVHHESDTYITTYTALDPLRSAGGTVALDGFFGWPLTAVAS
jgi:hypothetical protein